MELFEVQATEIIQSNSANNTYVLMLNEPESNQNIPIMIGEYETQVIIMARERVRGKRPLTHDLVCDILTTFRYNPTKWLSKDLKKVFFMPIYTSAME